MTRILAALLAAVVTAALPLRAAETVAVPDLAPNPGNLLMFAYVPDGLPQGAPLVVALHGCTQTARDFDDESGWTELADRYRFALLLPQQQAANNRDLCFNFFLEADNRRDRGEAASIAAMVARMRSLHGVDPGRVFVTGLSAGGAMTAVMLAVYPELFQGGAILAGVPYGCADTAGSRLLALQRRALVLANPYGEAAWAAYACGIDRTGLLQTAPRSRSALEWGELVRRAAPEGTRAWPKVSLWQGLDDRTVHPQNLAELVKQWTAVHGIDVVPDQEEVTPAYRRRGYAGPDGVIRVEAFELPGLEHAVPVDPGTRPRQCGRTVPPYFADRDLCAARRIAGFWGLAPAP